MAAPPYANRFPRCGPAAGKLLNRDRILDGTTPVCWVPGPPTFDWPGAGSLLRPPMVLRLADLAGIFGDPFTGETWSYGGTDPRNLWSSEALDYADLAATPGTPANPEGIPDPGDDDFSPIPLAVPSAALGDDFWGPDVLTLCSLSTLFDAASITPDLDWMVARIKRSYPRFARYAVWFYNAHVDYNLVIPPELEDPAFEAAKEAFIAAFEASVASARENAAWAVALCAELADYGWTYKGDLQTAGNFGIKAEVEADFLAHFGLTPG